jgi:hypothetical protein
MGPPSYMRSVVDRNVVMRRIPVISLVLKVNNTACANLAMNDSICQYDMPVRNTGTQNLNLVPKRRNASLIGAIPLCCNTN